MDTAILIVLVILLVVDIVILMKVLHGRDDSKLSELEKQVITLTEQNRNMNTQLAQNMNSLNENIRTYFRTLEDNLRIINDKLISDTNRQIEKLFQDVTRGVEKLDEDLNKQYEKQTNEMNMRIDKQNFDLNARIDKQNSALEESSRQTAESLKEINSIVSEKMQEILDRKINEAFATVVKNMTELGKNINDGQEKQREEIKFQLSSIKEEFSKIHTENKETMDKIRQDNQQSLDKINETVNEKLQKTLNDRINQSFETVNKRLAEVYEGLGEMKNVASGVKDLKNVLSNVKTRGILGEIQLSVILEDILTPEQYETQFKLSPDSRDLVDFAIKLPGQDNGQYIYLPIDSKFPGGKWGDLADAYESGNPALVKEKRKALEAEIKTCAKSIHDKYIRPPFTTDFAIMFLPFEGLYSEVVNMGLVETLQKDYKINITGPSTMAATLNSLQMGFRTLAIQKKSGEVWTILEAAKKEFANFAKTLESARNRIRKVDEDLDSLIGTRTNAINRKLRDITILEPDAIDAGDILGIEGE